MATESAEPSAIKVEADQLIPPADTPAQLPWPNASEQPADSAMFYQQSTTLSPVDARTEHHPEQQHQANVNQVIQQNTSMDKPHDSLPDVAAQSVDVQHVPDEGSNHVDPEHPAVANHTNVQVASVSQGQPQVDAVPLEVSPQVAPDAHQAHQVEPSQEVPPQVTDVSVQVQPHVDEIPQVVQVPQGDVQTAEAPEGAQLHDIGAHVANQPQPTVAPIVTPLESESVPTLDPNGSGTALHPAPNDAPLDSQGMVTSMETGTSVPNLDTTPNVTQLDSAPNVPQLDAAHGVQQLEETNPAQIEPSSDIPQLDTAMDTAPVVTALDNTVPPVSSVEPTSAASMQTPLDPLDKQPASDTVPALEPLDSKSLTVAPLHVLEKTNIAPPHHAHPAAPKQPDAEGDVAMVDAAQHNSQAMELVQTTAGLMHGLHAPMTDAHAQGAVPSSSAIPATVATSATATPVVPSAPIVIPATGAPGVMHSVGLSSAMVTGGLNTMVSAAQPTLAYAHAAGNTHHTVNYGNGGHPMELHENGNLLTSFANSAEHVENIGQTSVQAVNVLGTQGMPLHVTQNGATTAQPGRILPSEGGVDTGGMGMRCVPVEQTRKPQRLPGTKQCPTCSGIIAAAVAKCPKCGHVFREKKQKPKRSGKRGKKNCPKCKKENPSACSSCKTPGCGHVFRLKLMDRYKTMRPRNNGNGTTVTPIPVPAPSAGIVKSQTQGPPPMPTGPAVTAVPPAPISVSAAIPAAGVQQYTYAPLQMQAQPAAPHQLSHTLHMVQPATMLPPGTVVSSGVAPPVAPVGTPVGVSVGTPVGVSVGTSVGVSMAASVGPPTNMAPVQTVQTHAAPTQPPAPSTPIQQHNPNAVPINHTHVQNEIHHQGAHPQI